LQGFGLRTPQKRPPQARTKFKSADEGKVSKNKTGSFAKIKSKKMFDTLQSAVHTHNTKICGGGLIEMHHRFKPGSHIERRVLVKL